MLVAGISVASAAEPPPEVPEPLELDLVRGLGPRRGELEANVLGVVSLDHRHAIEWAPEIEWAPARDLAFEVELPMLDRRLEAIKLATQLTLHVSSRSRTAQGILVATALGLDRHQSAHALYVLAAELGRHGGLVTMIGPRWSVSPSHGPELGALLAASIFVSARNHHALGLEASWIRSAHTDELHLMPQAHLPLGRHARLQLGVGAHHEGMLGWGAVAGLRVIVER